MDKFAILEGFAGDLGIRDFASGCVVTEGLRRDDATLAVFMARATRAEYPMVKAVVIPGGDPAKSEQFSGMGVDWYLSRCDARNNDKEFLTSEVCDFLEGSCLLFWNARFHRPRLLELCPLAEALPHVDAMLLCRAALTGVPIPVAPGWEELNTVLERVPKPSFPEGLDNLHRSLFGELASPKTPFAFDIVRKILDMVVHVAVNARRS